MALATVVRAFFGYYFLVFVSRIVGRRPGKQMTPFEYVLIFFLGGLTLTGMVGKEASLVNAFCQITSLALAHYSLAYLRSRSARLARFLDGTPLLLLEAGQWRSNTLHRMGIQDDDVMAAARDKGLRSLTEIDTAVLERNGEISILSSKTKQALEGAKQVAAGGEAHV